MGIILRNAERLGVHRDGTFLGLSPSETEDRRRLWWQLQHLDLGLSVRSGITSLTLMLKWDTRLPLNIEDEDISAYSKDEPKERPGLTSMSYCRFTYWVIEQQRKALNAAKGSLELSWPSSTALSKASRTSVIDELEEGLNDNFLRFCDPIKPIDVLLQLVARALICGMRERMMHSLAFEADKTQINQAYREELLAACIQSLEYNIALHSHSLLSHFRWLAKAFFPWHACKWTSRLHRGLWLTTKVMCILVEVSQQSVPAKIERIWNLLAQLYAANTSLLELADDRRKLHAARLVVAAGQACQTKSNIHKSSSMSILIIDLESRLAQIAPTNEQAVKPNQSYEVGTDLDNTSTITQAVPIEQDVDAVVSFDFDFEDIDWEFWNSID